MSNRKQAAREGLHKYFTGKPCKRGHLSYRYTKTGTCAACVRLYTTEYGKQVKSIIDARKENQEITSVFKCHPDDEKTINDFIAALRASRKL